MKAVFGTGRDLNGNGAGNFSAVEFNTQRTIAFGKLDSGNLLSKAQTNHLAVRGHGTDLGKLVVRRIELGSGRRRHDLQERRGQRSVKLQCANELAVNDRDVIQNGRITNLCGEGDLLAVSVIAEISTVDSLRKLPTALSEIEESLARRFDAAHQTKTNKSPLHKAALPRISEGDSQWVVEHRRLAVSVDFYVDAFKRRLSKMASQLADNIPRVDFIQTLVEADLFRILTPVPKTSAIQPRELRQHVDRPSRPMIQKLLGLARIEILDAVLRKRQLRIGLCGSIHGQQMEANQTCQKETYVRHARSRREINNNVHQEWHS